MKDFEKEIKRRRDIIDRIDAVLVKLLNRRLRNVQEIGKFKIKAGFKAHAPKREREVIRNVSAANSGPLPTGAVKRLFEQIMSESRKVECATMNGIKRNRRKV